MKKFRVFIVLFIGLLFVGFTALAQENPMKKKGRSYEFPLNEMKQQPSFSLAQTEQQSQVNEQAKTHEATTATEEDTKKAEEQKVVLLVPFQLGTIFDIEILGVRFSLAIQPLGYGYGYGYPYYGSWYYGWGWSRYWYGNYWWNSYGYYNWAWNSWEWNYWGWYNPHRGRRPANYSQPIHASQLKDPRRNTDITTNAHSASPTLIAQSNTKNQVKSYPSRKSITRNTQQKFNGRISTRYAEPKQSRLFQKATPSTRPTANSRSILSRTQNARSSTPRISNQSRPAFSRTTLRPNLSRTGSSRISSPTRSSAPRSTAVRSSGASRSSAARTSAPRASSSRGGAVRRK